MTITVSRIPDVIECPECGCVQEAWIEFPSDLPHAVYVHHCGKCGYIIMESEWNSVTFDSDRSYSVDEIAENSHGYDEPEDYDGTVYLIARGRDGREYWFVDNGDGWRVSHTWRSFPLAKAAS